MGSAGSKTNRNSLATPTQNRERRLSHVDTNPPPSSDILVKCGVCSRTFASDRISRHEEVCSKQQKKKRNVFDVAEQRIEGTEAEQYKDIMGKTLSGKDLDRRGSHWKQQHEDMISALRTAKKTPRPPSAMENIKILT